MIKIYICLLCFTFTFYFVYAGEPEKIESSDACTDIIIGKLASVDGSVITSHTGASPECRVHCVPAQTFKKGTKTPVYYGIQNVKTELRDYGKIIGYIPQVEKTYAYFHSGYSHMNEHQLAIAESTIDQKKALEICYEDGCNQIMTIEQAQVFALQRCKKAKDAVKLIGHLLETYGFLPSCDKSGEALCIADPYNAWVLEVFAVGPDWTPESKKPGAVWAAQRVPDDHIAIVPNWSIIKEVSETDTTNFILSRNYKQFAIDRGWYDPESGYPFNWQATYAPIAREWAIGRFWLFYSTFAPNYKKWPDKYLNSTYDGYDAYHQYLEPVSYYPFSVKPEKKLSVQDVIAFQRSVFEGTVYDMTADVDWLVPDGKGGLVKSPLTTPFPTKELRELLDITWRRNVSRGGYGMVAQLRDWLPDPIGGVYWFYVDNQFVSAYVPIYAGVQEISPLYTTYDPDKYDEKSARWAVDFVDNLLYLRFQEGVKDLWAMRNPLEQSFFDEQSKIDKEAIKLFYEDPQLGSKYLTNYTKERMEKTVQMFIELRNLLISKYTNNKSRM